MLVNVKILFNDYSSDAEDIKLPAILERFGMPLIVKECATTVTLLITVGDNFLR